MKPSHADTFSGHVITIDMEAIWTSRHREENYYYSVQSPVVCMVIDFWKTCNLCESTYYSTFKN